MTKSKRRYSGNDNHFGPFTYSKHNDQGWRPFGLMLDSGGDHEDSDNTGCNLKLHGSGRTLIVELPRLLPDYRVKHVPTTWDAATIARLGRDHYFEVFPCEYGFTFSDKTLHVHYGPQTHDSITTKNKVFFLPWLNWRFVRQSWYGPTGQHIETLWETTSREVKRAQWDWRYEFEKTLVKTVFVIEDFDGVFALQDWEKSRGARIEVFTAVQMGKPVYSAEKWEEAPSRVRPETREYLDEYCALTDEELSAGLGGGIGVLQSRVEEGGYTPALEQVKAVFKRVSDVDLGGGEVRTTSATGGEKGVKPERLDLIPPGFLEELGRVYGEGAKKYSDVNYLFGYEWRKSIGAGLRHWMRFLQGEDIDPETGCHHLAHAAWHCATLITYQTEGLGTDDRLFHAIEQSKRGEL